jgi:hypothetical protein
MYLESSQKMIPIFIQLELAQARMLLEMFATIDDLHGLAGDMLELYNRLKEQIPN